MKKFLVLYHFNEAWELVPHPFNSLKDAQVALKDKPEIEDVYVVEANVPDKPIKQQRIHVLAVAPKAPVKKSVT